MARENVGSVFFLQQEDWVLRRLSVLEPCVLVLRSPQQGYHGPMRVGQPAYIKILEFVLLGKLRKKQSGDANEVEKQAMRSVLGALGDLARESRPDLLEHVSIMQSRFNKARVPDIQETNRVVRLANAHTDLALLVCKILVDQICFLSYGDASGGSTRAEQAQAGYVIMLADRALLEGLAAPVTLVSWRSHRVKRVVFSASAAEAIGSSEAIAQSDWVRGVGSESAQMERTRKCAAIGHGFVRMVITIIYTTKQSVPARTGQVVNTTSQMTFFAMQKCAIMGYRKELTITEYTHSASTKVNYKIQKEICTWYYVCVVTPSTTPMTT